MFWPEEKTTHHHQNHVSPPKLHISTWLKRHVNGEKLGKLKKQHGRFFFLRNVLWLSRLLARNTLSSWPNGIYIRKTVIIYNRLTYFTTTKTDAKRIPNMELSVKMHKRNYVDTRIPLSGYFDAEILWYWLLTASTQSVCRRLYSQ